MNSFEVFGLKAVDNLESTFIIICFTWNVPNSEIYFQSFWCVVTPALKEGDWEQKKEVFI